MRCYFHGDVDAVAVCKACHRAICHDCCAEVGPSVACRNRCESDVEACDALQRRATRTYGNVGKLYFGMAVIFWVFGLLSVGGSLLSLRSPHHDFGGCMYGLFFILMGGLFFRGSRRFQAQ